MNLTDDSFALRSTMLFAGMHFWYEYGNLEPFETTFLHHRVQVMSYIKTWIAADSHKCDTLIIRLMATLVFTEICNGEMLAAQTHVGGILAIIENADKNRDYEELAPRSTDQELSYRYLGMAYAYIYGLNNLLRGICRFGSSKPVYTAKELVQMIYTWHKAGAVESWTLKLGVLRLFPFFLSPLPHRATLNNADGRSLVKFLRQFTSEIEDVTSERSIISANEGFERFWRRGPGSELLEEWVLAHFESISVKKEGTGSSSPPQSSYETPWGALVTASLVYLQTILAVTEPFDERMHKYTITLFHQDMVVFLSETRAPGNPFLLWLLLMGLVGCHTSSKDEANSTIHPSTEFFQTAVRRQSREMAILCWPQALESLAEVVWPTSHGRGGFVEKVWERAVSTEY
ncbi:hypothetical protein NW752_001588 [Fusarium irregulare]|uniref:Uncharacterized protein n=1 Tax=Fusarium irregulare TaxID=2494466 RepID=A0A9W8PV39_9HYPO|nr:hypothetical protein NW766_003748 [Fusarium irregulare]KAJ4026634.1 hypothetical protein NW752_001588 [Fusarium irregulare]